MLQFHSTNFSLELIKPSSAREVRVNSFLSQKINTYLADKLKAKISGHAVSDCLLVAL